MPSYHFDGMHPFLGIYVGPGGVVGILKELIIENHLPPCILVGIGYEGNINAQRDRDFRNDRIPFYNFVKHELIPFVENTYCTNFTDRTLLGHSLGGTFTSYCLFQYNSSSSSLFKRFVTLSGNYQTHVFDALASESAMYERLSNIPNPSLEVSVFLAVGELDDPLFVSGNVNLTNRLNSRNYEDLRFFGKIYENFGHGSVVRPGFTDGLKWVFSDEKWDTDANTTNYADYGIFVILFLNIIIRLKETFLLSRNKNP
ncbi:MAG: alpha/beta hydrolase [Candidatus Heimdallarchaeota archaeon]